MNTFNENQQNGVDNVKNVNTELVDLNNLKELVVDTIATLVTQANSIEKENSTESIFKYENIESPTDYIGKTDEKAVEARNKFNELKQMKQSHFWTIGRNKAKVEKSQEVISEIIDAVDNNANATKALFNAQVDMAIFSKKLYSIGLMGIVANRMVVREVKLRLKNASEEELSDLARQELESVIYELQKQENIEKKIDDNHKKLTIKIEKVHNIINNDKEFFENELNDVKNKSEKSAKQVDEISRDTFARITELNKVLSENKELLTKELCIINEKYEQIAKQVDENNKQSLAKFEETYRIIYDNKNLLIKELDFVKELYHKLTNQMDESYRLIESYRDNYNRRLDILEKKTFFDSLSYKIILAIVVFAAFILSLLPHLGY